VKAHHYSFLLVSALAFGLCEDSNLVLAFLLPVSLRCSLAVDMYDLYFYVYAL